jgi:TolB-like protein/DNA-binding winged helix-turn-helix (wHTH) protein
MPGPVYQFGDFRLDCGAFELLRNGEPLRVERKPMELLILLVSREGQLVTRTEIAERLWSSEVFVDTEHGINTAIRKLRYSLRDDPDNPQFIQTITGMGYRFVAQIATPEGLSATEPVAATVPSHRREVHFEEPKTAAPSRKPRFWIALSAVAAVLMTTLFLTIGPHSLAARLFHRDARPTITSIAVLPLDNLSGDPNQEYFADGMTDELITTLAKNSTLRITSRTSVMQYKGARQPLPQIAQSLGVEGILEGSISRSNDRVHLTLQLIRAETDTHLWAESYDRDASGVVNLPVEASQAIARHLRSYVSPASPLERTVNPAAHDAYLRGRYLWWSGQGDRGFSDFKRAIELQPDYALGWASELLRSTCNDGRAQTGRSARS